MNLIMQNVTFTDMTAVRSFLLGNKHRSFAPVSRKQRYDSISETLVSLRYLTLRKKERGEVCACLRMITGYGPQQLKRLIHTWKMKGLRYHAPRARGATIPRYQPQDIALLITTDIAHRTLNGHATRAILQREFAVFGNTAYATIAGISVSHLYNIRNHKKQYLSSGAVKYSKTVPVGTNIGERKKPSPCGVPGFLRVDSVHQGDYEGAKGVYHINIVDEVLQWEMVGCVEQLADTFVVPLLEDLLAQFPFVIHNFHSDNGSEYINRQVAGMLERLRITQTKSRPRHSNDNGLAETKNGSIIRKSMGRNYIPQRNAPRINAYDRDYFNIYLNYHRVSAFATDYVDARGKVRKKYETYMTPYERLKALPSAATYLRAGVSFEQLDTLAYAQSDNAFAEMMKKAKVAMLKRLQT